jgi:heme exporter protein C
MKRHWDSLVIGLGLVGMLGAIAVIVLWVPPGQKEAGGIAQKIFYFHVSSAWTAFHGFLLALVGGIGYLRSRKDHWDLLNHASVEVAMLFCTLVVFTGPIWAKPVWGRYWNAEPRLLSFTIMWFTYAAFLVLRGALAGSSRRAPICAVYSILASINVPLVYYSVRMVRSEAQLHPRDIGLSPKMRLTLYFTLLCFTLLWIGLTSMRFRIARIEADQDQRALQEAMGALDGE